MIDSGALFSELMRPRQLRDLTLSATVIDRLQAMIDQDAILNLIFYGKPGAGKTSAARLIVAHYAGAAIERSGPKLRTADDVEREITAFTRTVSLSGKRKLCFIDEADGMSKTAQSILRKVVEDSYSNCRFILAVNDQSKLQAAILSRLQPIPFEIRPADRNEVMSRLLIRYEHTLSNHELAFNPQRLNEIIHFCWPDLRAVANQIDFEFGRKSLVPI